MSQQKKPQYNVCPRLTDKTVNTMRRTLKQFKHMSDAQLLHEVFSMHPSMLASLDAFIYAEEKFHVDQGSHVIFPENKAVLDNLFRAKFKIEDSNYFDFPFRSFVLAIPQGYKIEGYDIPSCLVTWSKYRESEHDIYYPFMDWIKTPRPREIQHQKSLEDDMQLGIVIKDPKIDMAYQRMLVLGSSIPQILASETVDDFKTAIGDYRESNLIGIIPTDPYDQQIQYRLFKLITALAVYNIATNGIHLKNGFPGSLEPKVIGRDSSQRIIQHTLGNYLTPEERAKPTAHYRSWFFRQLRDEVYYQGEYKDTPRGSRISFVPATMVNRQVTAHTQD